MRTRRWYVAAIAVSLALHAPGIVALRRASTRPVAEKTVIEVRLAEGGAQAAASAPPRPALPRQRKEPARARQRETRDSAPPLAENSRPPARGGAQPDAAPPALGVRVLVRVDRLGASPCIQAVDTLIRKLPEGRDLLEGTGIDLRRDIDAFLIEKSGSTSLVARHRLSEAELRAALDRGARAQDLELAWQTERGRPVAEWRPRQPGAAASVNRRRFWLATPELVVVTGSTEAGVPGNATVAAGWKALFDRLDADDPFLPPDAVAMTTATGVLPAGVELPAPRILVAMLVLVPQPFLDIDAELSTDDEAVRWEQEWATARQRLLEQSSLTDGQALWRPVTRMTLARSGCSVHLHLDLSESELIGVLEASAALSPRVDCARRF